MHPPEPSAGSPLRPLWALYRGRMLIWQLLYSTATGDPGDPLVFPLNAVRWRTPPRDLAVLVTASGPSRFRAELFHFGAQPREIEAELFLLEPGDYRLRFITPGADVGSSPREVGVSVSGPRTRIVLRLPSRRLCVVELDRWPVAP